MSDVRLALATTARALADDGESGETVLSGGVTLPPALRSALEQVVRAPDPEVGYRVVPRLFDPDRFGDQRPTPPSWREIDPRRSGALDIALTLVASVLGDVFGWANQQDGRIVHNILPSPGCEDMQVGASSTSVLDWHTEDAFHPDRADFLMLACVRNPLEIGSRLATVNRASLTDAHVSALVQPCVVIVPDDSYQDDSAERREPVGMSTLWRRAAGLGLRYDPYYSRMITDDAGFLQAYAGLRQVLDDCSVVVPFEAGDLLVVDNDVTAHSRAAFPARYDGTDRWLKRVLVRSPRMRPASEPSEHGFGQVRVHARRPLSLRR